MLRFLTKTNGNKMTFCTQIMFEPFRCLLKDVLKSKIPYFFNPFAYPVFSLIRRVLNRLESVKQLENSERFYHNHYCFLSAKR